MAILDKLNRVLRRVQSIELTRGTALVVGRINISGTISMDTGGLYTVFTVPAGYYFEPHLVKFRMSGGTASSDMSGSCGTGVAANDIFTSRVFTNVRAVDDMYMVSSSGNTKRCPPGSVISFNVTSPATGAAPIGEVTIYGELTQ